MLEDSWNRLMMVVVSAAGSAACSIPFEQCHAPEAHHMEHARHHCEPDMPVVMMKPRKI